MAGSRRQIQMQNAEADGSLAHQVPHAGWEFERRIIGQFARCHLALATKGIADFWYPITESPEGVGIRVAEIDRESCA